MKKASFGGFTALYNSGMPKPSTQQIKKALTEYFQNKDEYFRGKMPKLSVIKQYLGDTFKMSYDLEISKWTLDEISFS